MRMSSQFLTLPGHSPPVSAGGPAFFQENARGHSGWYAIGFPYRPLCLLQPSPLVIAHPYSRITGWDSGTPCSQECLGSAWVG